MHTQTKELKENNVQPGSLHLSRTESKRTPGTPMATVHAVDVWPNLPLHLAMLAYPRNIPVSRTPMANTGHRHTDTLSPSQQAD